MRRIIQLAIGIPAAIVLGLITIEGVLFACEWADKR